MSKHTIEKFTCPSCSKENDFTLWHSINTVLSPEMVEKIHSHDAFKFKCEECGYEAEIEYSFLYHMMKERIMIQYAPTEEEAKGFIDAILTSHENNKLGTLMSDFLNHGYTIRIARNKNEFYEKIAIYEAGLDDRVIEILKLFYLVKANENQLKNKADEVFFANTDDGEYVFVFYSDGKFVASSEISKEIILDMGTKYKQAFPTNKEDNLFVDRNWVIKHIFQQ